MAVALCGATDANVAFAHAKTVVKNLQNKTGFFPYLGSR